MLRHPVPRYVPQESELLRAYEAAKTLAELLELVDMPFEAQVARETRERLFLRLEAIGRRDAGGIGPRGEDPRDVRGTSLSGVLR